MYRIFIVGLVTLYALATWRGWELSSTKRGVIPKEARQQSGGYRSYHFWRGGK